MLFYISIQYIFFHETEKYYINRDTYYFNNKTDTVVTTYSRVTFFLLSKRKAKGAINYEKYGNRKKT